MLAEFHSKIKSKIYQLIALPGLIWIISFLVFPLVLVFAVSFLRKGTYGGVDWTFDLHHWSMLSNPSYFKIILLSLGLATITSVSTVGVGLVLAWATATMAGSRKQLALGLIALPSFLNLIIRVYSIKLFVGTDGPLQGLLTLLHIPFDPFYFSQNQVLVIYGMFTSYLPFAFLPIYSALEKFDFSLVEAAQDLGADSLQVLFLVLIPALKKSLKGAFVLVFIPSLGEYVIPDLLGGGKQMYLGNLISDQFLKVRDWPVGSALAVILILGLFVFSMINQKNEIKSGDALEI